MINVTSLAELHVPLVTVHLNMAVPFAGRPVTPELYNVVSAMVAVPDIFVQAPTPDVGRLAANVKLPLAHCLWSDPAAAVVTCASFLNDTSLYELQVPLVMVQRRTAVPFERTPVTPLLYKVASVIVAVPDDKDHKPIPVVG